jgi:hypothetical protein
VAVELWPGNTAVLDVHPAVTVVPATVLPSVKLARLTVPVFRTETWQSMVPAGREDKGVQHTRSDACVTTAVVHRSSQCTVRDRQSPERPSTCQSEGKQQDSISHHAGLV